MKTLLICIKLRCMKCVLGYVQYTSFVSTASICILLSSWRDLLIKPWWSLLCSQWFEPCGPPQAGRRSGNPFANIFGYKQNTHLLASHCQWGPSFNMLLFTAANPLTMKGRAACINMLQGICPCRVPLFEYSSNPHPQMSEAIGIDLSDHPGDDSDGANALSILPRISDAWGSG